MGYLRLGIGIATLLFAAWAFRMNHLRADHLQVIDDTVVVLKEAGLGGANRGNLAASTKTLVGHRDTARAERDTARALVDSQSASIAALEKETQEYIANGEAQRRMIAQTIKQRDMWIARARTAANRTERLSAEEEVRECDAVLNSLYSSGF